MYATFDYQRMCVRLHVDCCKFNRHYQHAEYGKLMSMTDGNGYNLTQDCHVWWMGTTYWVRQLLQTQHAHVCNSNRKYCLCNIIVVIKIRNARYTHKWVEIEKKITTINKLHIIATTLSFLLWLRKITVMCFISILLYQQNPCTFDALSGRNARYTHKWVEIEKKITTINKLKMER